VRVVLFEKHKKEKKKRLFILSFFLLPLFVLLFSSFFFFLLKKKRISEKKRAEERRRTKAHFTEIRINVVHWSTSAEKTKEKKNDFPLPFRIFVQILENILYVICPAKRRTKSETRIRTIYGLL